MRVTSALFVSALIRREYARGGAAVIQRRGAEEAGAILIVIDRLDGSADLYGPAPQSAFDHGRPDDRLFQRLRHAALSAEIDATVARELRFDSDIWIVVVEDRTGTPLFATVPDPD